MLLRAYRVTDRFGIVLLKSSVALTDATLAGLVVVRRAASAVLARVLTLLAAVLGVGLLGLRGLGLGLRQVGIVLGRFVVALARLLVLVVGALFGVLVSLLRVSFSTGGNVARGTTRVSGRVARSAGAAATGTMARRTARAEITTTVSEDPLRVQNRVLSALVVLLGVAVLGVILWATDPGRTTGTPISANLAPVAAAQSNLQPVASNGTPQTTPQGIVSAPTLAALPSPVPTATSLPSILEVRGSLAYVVRESGQTDIWALPVGSRNPVRMTNSPEDERDPAWSPDGRKLAYASRQEGNWELYVYDLTRDETTRMTYDLSFQGAPQWSPDGEWLVYESYQGNNLDVYVMRIDGSQAPLRLTDHALPDFSPAWSPDGRTIAFISWREGNQDIFLFSLDDPRDEAVVNLTNTPDRDEDYPAWSPDGKLLAFSAIDEGLEKVFVQQVENPDAAPQVLERGRSPSWSPDGTSIVFTVDSSDSTHLVAGPFADSGIATEIIPVPRGATDPVWTSAPLPQQLVNSGGLDPAITEPLYIEQENEPRGDPPFRLNVLNNVSAPNAILSERVNDSFMALREQASDRIGWDFLGQLEDAFWQIERPPQPGEERRNWLMTGRGFAMNRNAIVGFPAPIEVVREELDVNTYWRVFVRVSDEAQSGQLGEPLRRMPWDFASRNQGDVEAYNQGGRIRREMPAGYYIDLTQLAEDFGWTRVPAGSDWRRNFNSTNYWLFQKRDGLTWYDAMRELYPEAQLGGFAPPAVTPSAPLPDPITQVQQGSDAAVQVTTDDATEETGS